MGTHMHSAGPPASTPLHHPGSPCTPHARMHSACTRACGCSLCYMIVAGAVAVLLEATLAAVHVDGRG